MKSVFFLLSYQTNDQSDINILFFFSNFHRFSPSWQEKVRYLRHLKRYLKNSYRFRIRFQNGSIWAPQNVRSLKIRYPDISTQLNLWHFWLMFKNLAFALQLFACFISQKVGNSQKNKAHFYYISVLKKWTLGRLSLFSNFQLFCINKIHQAT